MPKKKARKASIRTTGKSWAGFTPFQLIVILSVFVIFAVLYLSY